MHWLFATGCSFGFRTLSPVLVLGAGGEVAPGPWSVGETFLNSKGSFFGTPASFLFRHLKNLGEPYKDQKQAWPQRLSDMVIPVG